MMQARGTCRLRTVHSSFRCRDGLGLLGHWTWAEEMHRIPQSCKQQETSSSDCSMVAKDE